MLKSDREEQLLFFTIVALMLIFIMTSGCASNDQKKFDCNANTQDDARPDILVIGDSVSMKKAPESVAQGYLVYLQARLPEYDVSHNYCNGRTTVWSVQNIDRWLSQRPAWELITFNHGLHDSGLLHNDPAYIDTYRANLMVIAQKIKARTQRPLFVLTTEYMPGVDYGVSDLNRVATEVMQAEGIPIVDLYSVSLTIPHLHLNPQDVHYTEKGSEVLGNALADEIFNIYGIGGLL